MDETCVKVKGDLCRAVAKRDMAAAKRFFDETIGANGDPNKVAIDKSRANKAAIDAINAGRGPRILVRQVQYLNNIVEQRHRAIKRLTSLCSTINCSGPPALYLRHRTNT